MAKYRKKPVIIDAIVWDGKIESLEALEPYETPSVEQDLGCTDLVIPTLEGNHTARVGDYIIKGVKGELYPCKAEIFALTYEAA